MTRARLAAGLWLLLSFIAFGSMSFYTFRIWSANQPAGFSDLYAPWWGAHEMLLHRRNPYSPEVTRDIQSVIYESRFASAEDSSKLGGGFAYPPYVALLLWPLVYLPFSAAQEIFAGLALAATLLSIFLWTRSMNFRPPPLTFLTVILFAFGSFPILQGIHLENLSLLAAALIAVAIFLVSANHLSLGGALLALSTVKPQFVILLIPWLLVWAVSDWRRRRAVVISFLVTTILVLFASEWLVPGWVSNFVSVVRAYRHYTYGHSVLEVWFGPGWGSLIAATVLFIVFSACWPYRSRPAESPTFIAVVSLLLATTLVVIPTLAPHTQIILLPGFLVLLRSRNLLRAGRLAGIWFAPAWLLLAWPWVAALGLSLASVWVPIANLYRFWQIPLLTSPLLPVGLALAVAFLMRLPDSAPGTDRSQ